MSDSFIKGVTDEYKQKLTEFLFRLFARRSGLKQSILERYINDKTIYKFALALTHESYNLTENYEYFETLGDATLNKCTVWYFHRRYPLLKTYGDANTRMSLIKNKYVSRHDFAELSRMTGVDNLVRLNQTYTLDGKTKYVKIDEKLRTDVFEALMGCIEDTIDDVEDMIGLGSSIVYNMYSSLMDEREFSIKLEDLLEPKTIILQLEAKNKIKIIEKKKNEKINVITNMLDVQTDKGIKKEPSFIAELTIEVFNPFTNKKDILSYISTPKRNKLVSEQEVATKAITELKTKYNISFVSSS